MSKLKNDNEQFKKYLSGDMSAQEAHAFERNVLNDPFEQEALEGLESIGSDQAFSDVEKLQNKVLTPKRSGSGWMKIAAAVALLIVSSLAVWLVIDPLAADPELAMKKEAQDEAENATESDEELKPEEVVIQPIEEVDNVSPEEDNSTAPAAQRNEEILAAAAAQSKPAVVADAVFQPEPTEEFEEVSSNSVADLQVADLEKMEPVIAEQATVDEVEIAIPNTDVLQGRVAGVEIARSTPMKLEENMQSADQMSFASETKQSREAAKKSKRIINSQDAASENVALSAPSRTVSGKVLDDSGEGLPGVNVVVKGSTTGTITDLDGNFQLNVDENARLVVSYIGFTAQEVQVDNQDSLDITLDGGVGELSEVVVTGYGTSGPGNESTYSAATPEGGNRSYKKYLSENLAYPEAAEANDIEGTVILELTIASNGSISDIAIKKGIGFGCDAEAIRLVKDGPEWSPAEKDGVRTTDKVKVKVKFKQ